jgi:hypothetical protein
VALLLRASFSNLDATSFGNIPSGFQNRPPATLAGAVMHMLIGALASMIARIGLDKKVQIA